MALLEADGISKNYEGRTALVDFSLQLEAARICSLVGPDGAGKTTLVRIVCRLLDPDSGRVTIDGMDTVTSFEKIKPILGYMPQQFSLYPDLSVEENMIFYAGLYGLTGRAYREKRDYLFEFSNLGPFANRRAGALSGGMKQKLALSCALIHEPRLLILDEPTTGVDPLSRRQFWEILLQLRDEGVGILVSTPYMDEVARCDQACFVLGGRKLSQGTPAQLAEGFVGKIYYVDCEPSAELVNALDGKDHLTARRFGAGLHLYLSATDDISNHTEYLRTHGIDPTLVTPMQPSLEDRFIQLMEAQ